jgi:hypothetical protein
MSQTMSELDCPAGCRGPLRQRNLNVGALVIDPIHTSTVYAGTGGDGGVFKSVDGGASWTKLAQFRLPGYWPFPVLANQIYSLLVDFVSPNILYASTARANGGCLSSDKLVFRSTDGGMSWSDSISPRLPVCEISEKQMVMDPTDPSTIYLAGGYARLLKTTDRGENWSGINDFGLGLSSAPTTLLIDPTNPATRYAGTNNGVSKSTDGGTTWAAPV